MIKVTKLATSGPAAAQGVKPGDILIEIATKDGRDLSADRQVLRSAPPYSIIYPTEIADKASNMNMNVKQVTKLTKGSPESSIKLKLKRELKSGFMEYEVTLKRSGTGTSEMARIRGMQGRVPGTVRCFDKVHDWVQVACVSVSESESAIESLVPGRGTTLQISTVFHQRIHSIVYTGTPEHTRKQTREGTGSCS